MCHFFSFPEEEEEENKDSKSKSNQLSKKQLKALAAKEAKQQAYKKVTFNHPLLLTSLKEHSQNVLDFDFSMNGKYLASCSEGENFYSFLFVFHLKKKVISQQ